MAQLRLDYPEFKALNTEVMVLLPNGPKIIARYVRETATPYLILSDPGSKTASAYFQIRRFFLLGTPSLFLVAPGGLILYACYSSSLIKAPDNREPLAVLAARGAG